MSHSTSKNAGKRFTLSDEQLKILKDMSSVGTPLDIIADRFSISLETLRHALKRQDAARNIHKEARAQYATFVRGKLAEQIKIGNVNAMKTYFIFVEGIPIKKSMEHSGPDGGPIETTELSRDERRKRIEDLKKKLE